MERLREKEKNDVSIPAEAEEGMQVLDL